VLIRIYEPVFLKIPEGIARCGFTRSSRCLRFNKALITAGIIEALILIYERFHAGEVIALIDRALNFEDILPLLVRCFRNSELQGLVPVEARITGVSGMAAGSRTA